MNAIAVGLHVLASVVWVGGMFFAYIVLRPSATQLEPPLRLALWSGVFKRFFPWVWLVILVLLISGYWMIFGVWKGFAATPLHVHIMQLAGFVMIGVFVLLYYRHYPPFKTAVIDQRWPEAANHLNSIRRLILVNLVLGMLVVLIAASGRYW